MSKKDKYGYRPNPPRYFKADFELQQKVGTGHLDPEAVSKVQSYLDQVDVDVTPDLRHALEEIETALGEAKSLSYDREQFLPPITRALMNIKATSGMFRQMMLCRVSAFLLTFLEDVRKFDKDVIDIIGAYLRVARTLLDMKITDETNEYGQVFLQEIRAACKRYYDKQAAAVKG